MKKITLLLIVLAFSITFWACEDVITIELQDGVEQLTVDAWLTNEAKTQTISLTYSQAYFDNSTPKPALGATVLVFNADSTRFEFTDDDNNGTYTYTPTPEKPILTTISSQYALYIKHNTEEYYSLSTLNRVPKIDSVSYEVFEFPVALNDSTPKSGFLGQFYAKDFSGLNDTYWIRFSKNGKLNRKPNLISIAYDAGFSPGSMSDGLQFILPLRQSINDGLLQENDSVRVDLYSITNEAFYFLFQIRQESANAGIFATPSANIPTNIFNLDATSDKKALGFFCVSNVNSYSFVVDKDKAKPKR